MTGMAAAVDIDSARDMLRDTVAAYLDAGPSETGVASTIIDATTLVGGAEPQVRVLREGAISRERLREVLGDLLEPDPEDAVDPVVPSAEASPDSEAPGP